MLRLKRIHWRGLVWEKRKKMELFLDMGIPKDKGKQPQANNRNNSQDGYYMN